MGIDGMFIKTDVTQTEQIETAITKIETHYGRIDGIVNNVGVNDGVNLDASIEAFVNSLKLNLISYFATVKYAFPLLKKSGGLILW